jgi:transcriptional regulator with XRE-family HTH domain
MDGLGRSFQVSDNIQAIAIRICDLREIEGLTQQQVSEAAWRAAGRLHGIREGRQGLLVQPPFHIANALGVDISDLLTGESPKRRAGYVVTRSGQGLAFERRRAYHYQHLAYNFRDKKAEPFLVTVEYDGRTSARPPRPRGAGIRLRAGRPHADRAERKSRLPGCGGFGLLRFLAAPCMYALDADAKFIAVVIK